MNYPPHNYRRPRALRFTLIELLVACPPKPVWRRREKLSRFTLIELLVVVAIISILAAMLLPALTSARNKAYQIHCMTNTKTLAFADIIYAEESEGFLCPYLDGTPRMAWPVLISPWVGNDLRMFVCPTQFETLTSLFPAPFKLSYGINYQYIGRPGKKLNEAEKPSDTIMFGDSARHMNSRGTSTDKGHTIYIDWTPTPSLDRSVSYSWPPSGHFVYTRHHNKGNVSYADGHASLEPTENIADKEHFLLMKTR